MVVRARHLSLVEWLKEYERPRWEPRLDGLRRSGVPLAAAAPAFAATVNNGAISVSATADTSYTAPSNAVTVFTAGASGSKVDEIAFEGTGTTVAGTITVFIHDGSTFHLYDCINVPVVTASTTSAPWRTAKSYPNLVLKSGWSVRCASTVTSQLVKVSAFGGDF